jgi:U3 small nucleolar RNA-associated protein 19
MRLIVRQLLFPSASLRGAELSKKSGTWKIVADNQIDLEEGVLPEVMIELVDQEFWAKYDDLRWAFFREASYIIQNEARSLPHPSNLLSQFIPLTNLPKLPEDINAFYIPSLADAPSTSSNSSKKPKKNSTAEGKRVKGKGKGKGKGKEGDLDSTPDWMAYYDSDSGSEDDASANGLAKAGTKRSRTRSSRTSHMSILAGIHSIPSHQAVYTQLWETVFSHVPLDVSWTRKILVGLHGTKGILGHMKPERRVRVADWLGSLIDGGGANAMLAMNGLYILMTQYNL